MPGWQTLLTGKQVQSSIDQASINEVMHLLRTKPSLYWAPLQSHKLIFVSGQDAEKFLQGQCTCDLTKNRNNNQILLGAHCNPKGRMLSSFALTRLDQNCFALKIHDSIAESALAALKKYIIFSKADIKIAHDWLILGIAGTNSTQHIGSVGFTAPPIGEFSASQSAVVLHADTNQFEIWIQKPSIDNLLKSLMTMPRVPDSTWDLLNIRRGHAEIRQQTQAQLLPQELNFQLVDGVSFNKGCYTGQEIIARVHYKSTLKKHMYRAQANTTELVSPGAALIENSTGKTVGSVILSAQSDQSSIEILALCSDEAKEQQIVRLDTNSAANLQWLPLPYAIPK